MAKNDVNVANATTNHFFEGAKFMCALVVGAPAVFSANGRDYRTSSVVSANAYGHSVRFVTESGSVYTILHPHFVQKRTVALNSATTEILCPIREGERAELLVDGAKMITSTVFRVVNEQMFETRNSVYTIV